MPNNYGMPQMPKVPDPKTIVDSVLDGAIEIAEGPVKTAEGIAAVATAYAAGARANLEEIKRSMPDDPSAIPGVAVKAVSQSVRASIGLVQSLADGVTSGLNGVQSQISRVTG